MVPAHTVYGWGARHVPAAFAYSSPIGGTATAHGIKTNGTMKDDGKWHEVALSHFWANQTTNMYLDGEVVGQLAAERVTPFLFTLSPTTPTVRRPLALTHAGCLVGSARDAEAWRAVAGHDDRRPPHLPLGPQLR